MSPQPTDMLPLSRPTMQLGFRARKVALSTLAAYVRSTIELVKGDKGDPGERGLPGPASTVQGPKGDPGSQGIPGPIGPTGVANARIKTVPLPAGLLGINLSQTITVTWDAPFADDAYVAVANLQTTTAGINLATLQVSQRAKTAAGVTYQVTNVGLSLNLSGANLVVLAVRP